MDRQELELIKISGMLELELWRMLMERLDSDDRDLLHFHKAMQIGRLMLEGVLRTGPAFNRDDTREALEENVAKARSLLQEAAEVGAGG